MTTTATSHAPPRSDHVHPDVPLETAFDFLNTLELEYGALVERLTTLEAAANWLTGAQVIAEPRAITDLAATGRGRQRLLQRLLATRTALRDVAHAVAHGETPDDRAVDQVNQALRARQRIELVTVGDGVRLGHSHVGDVMDDLLARIAEPIVREIGSDHDDRIRICANDTCRWLFYDESRAGRRRWCDMATCGNRAKARRHRARQRNAATTEPSPTGTSA